MTTQFNAIPTSSADPAAVAGAVTTYAKTVLGVVQLFARASDGTVSQLTPGGGGGMAIGGAVTGGTAGSTLYVGAGPVLAQDNANYFYDDTNKRLGIGTAAPGTTLDIASAGNTAALALRGGSAAAVSAASTGRLRYNQTTQKAQFSANAAAYLDMALLAAALTQNSVLFADASGNIAQNNAAFSWTDSARVFRITQNAADPADGTGAITLRNTLNTSLAQIVWKDNTGTFKAALGYSNNGGTSPSYFYADNGGWGLLFSGPGGSAVQIFSGTANLAGQQFWNGSSLSVSAASTGRIRYNTTGQKFQFSANAAAYVDVGTYAAALTDKSVLFANASNQIAQDNAGFRYTSATRNLMIGTDAVTANFTGFPLTMSVSSTDIVQYVWNTNTAGFGAVGFLDNTRAFKMNVGYGNSTSASPYTSLCFIQTATDLTLISITGPAELARFGMTSGSFMFQMANGSGAAVSAANTGRLRYNTTGQKAQMSFNAGSYFDVATYAAALTTGSVPFANGSNQLAQDNANFFYDSANSQLRIGANPALTSYALTTTKSITGSSIIYVRNTDATGYSSIDYYKSDNTHQAALGYGNATVAVTHVRNLAYWYSSGPNFVFANATKNEFTYGMVDGSTFIEQANGSGAAVSTANTGRFIYTTTGQKYQVSKNAAAYEDVATLATQQTFTKSQNVASVALTDAANIATNAANGNTFTVTLGGNRTLDNPTNLVAGGIYRWVITQDGVGGRTLAYGTLFKWPGGAAPVLTAAAGAKDSITAIYDGAVLLAQATLNYA